MRKLAFSNLVTHRWDLGGDDGPYRLIRPTTAQLRAVDEEWPLLRDPGEASREWRWRDIAERAAEVFAVVAADGRQTSIWSTARPRIHLEGKVLYRLDFMEVLPPLRKRELGAFTLAVIACRAAELDCVGVVLASFRTQAGFYRKVGAVQRRPRGWNTESNLIPFVIEAESFTRLKERADAVREESPASSSPPAGPTTT